MRLGARIKPARAWHGSVVTAVVVVAVLAGGCRQNERGRPLDFAPHVYRGDRLPALNEQELRHLRERGNLQR
jgi:hypothetical protein